MSDSRGRRQPSLLARALLAIALTIVFYVLAISIAVGLIAAPVLMFVKTSHGNVWLSVAMIGAGLTILRAILPARGALTPPGPELRRDEQPQLFAELDAVATAVGQRRPDVVYLELVANASVFEHRGRRMMTLGVPVLATLAPEELRAVVAHEYGHFASGDTRFGAWIWRTRAAALKTAARLTNSRSRLQRALVRWPFVGYARLFLRITNAVSRRAEFDADAMSARVASPEAAGRALRRMAVVSAAFDSFWATDVAPMLEARRRPPVALGFIQMVSHHDLRSALDHAVEADLEPAKAGAYDSHPTLRERLAALDQPADPQAPPAPATTSLSLLTDLPRLERDLLEHRFGADVAGFVASEWDAAAEVHVAAARQAARDLAGAIPAGAVIDELGDLATDLRARGAALGAALGEQVTDASDARLEQLAFQALVSGAVGAAADAGARVTAAPGENLIVHARGHSVDVPRQLGRIASGEAEPREWRASVEELGLAGARLISSPAVETHDSASPVEAPVSQEVRLA